MCQAINFVSMTLSFFTMFCEVDIKLLNLSKPASTVCTHWVVANTCTTNALLNSTRIHTYMQDRNVELPILSCITSCF